MEYFNLDKISRYSLEINTVYDSESEGAKTYYDTRKKLKYLGDRIANELDIVLINNYDEKPNKMAGRGQGFVLKDYILTGFIPFGFSVGKMIFVKLSFDNFINNVEFGIDVDVNFSDQDNAYNISREKIQADTFWRIPVDQTFPDIWEDLIRIVKPVFLDRIKYITRFLSTNQKYYSMEEYIKILKQKKQIILQGPPGTGKTFTAKDIAELLINDSISEDKKEQKRLLEVSGQFELVQFHPAYTYEDFVRSLSAKSVDGQIEYVTENKVLADFADKAQKNLINHQKDESDLSKEQKIRELLEEFAEYVQDEIDQNGEYSITKKVSIVDVESDAFRYKGDWISSQLMKFDDLIKAQLSGVTSRKDFKQLENINGLAIQHATYFFNVLSLFRTKYGEDIEGEVAFEVSKPPLKDYILVIDEINRANLPAVLGELIYALEYRGEKVNSMYSVDGDPNIIIPENLFIIGTMNTADRSVGHIDYAIRRRFAFEKLLPNIDVIETDIGKEYFKIVEELFKDDSLSPDYRNSAEDIQIGHSYFMGKEVNLKIRMKYEVIPILREYLKDGVFIEETKEKLDQFEEEIST